MSKLFLVLCILLYILPMPAWSASIEEHILSYYPELVEKLQNHNFKGPIAKEVAKFSLLRQVHEDGRDRNHDVSINGMTPGGRNKEVIEEVVKPPIILKIITAYDGQQTYALYGQKANIFSAIAIAKLFDKYIKELSICTTQEISIWERSLLDSQIIDNKTFKEEDIIRYHSHQALRHKMLGKANKCYGPEGESLNREVTRLEELFNLRKEN